MRGLEPWRDPFSVLAGGAGGERPVCPDRPQSALDKATDEPRDDPADDQDDDRSHQIRQEREELVHRLLEAVANVCKNHEIPLLSLNCESPSLVPATTLTRSKRAKLSR